MKLTPEEIAIITARRKRGDTWKAIAWDLEGHPDPKALRKRFVRAGGDPVRDKLPVILPNFRIADQHYEWLAQEAKRNRTSIAAMIRIAIASAMGAAP